MFENFSSRYKFDDPIVGDAGDASSPPEVRALFEIFGGGSFNGGIYRIVSTRMAVNLNDVVARTFPQFGGKINCFGVDWLGRLFAQDKNRLVDGLPGVVMFEPGTREVLRIPCNIVSFHENELIEYREEALAEKFYFRWIEAGGRAPAITQCVGYKQPLFLGGVDELENLELSDLDVYWEVASLMILRARGVPIGSSVGKIELGN